MRSRLIDVSNGIMKVCAPKDAPENELKTGSSSVSDIWNTNAKLLIYFIYFKNMNIQIYKTNYYYYFLLYQSFYSFFC